MGAFNSINRPDSPEPSSLNNPVSMSDSAPQTQSEQPQSDTKPSSPEQPPSAAESDATQPEIGDDEDENEERGECGFCVFMKGGACRESFVAWENCVEEAENKKEDIPNKCFELTLALKDCMLAHPDYYGAILRAEKAAEEQAVEEIDKRDEEEGNEEREVAVVTESLKEAGDEEESAGGKE